jgi:hypothetical protein
MFDESYCLAAWKSLKLVLYAGSHAFDDLGYVLLKAMLKLVPARALDNFLDIHCLLFQTHSPLLENHYQDRIGYLQ